MTEQYFTISTKTIVKIVATLLLLWFLYLIRDIILIIFVSLIFAALIDPVADWFARKKISRALGVIVVYVIFVGLFVLVGALMVPPLVHQSSELVSNLSKQWEKIASSVHTLRDFSNQFGVGSEIESSINNFGTSLQNTFGNVFNTVTGFFGSIFSSILVLVLTFYMVVQEDTMRRAMRVIVPDQYQPFVMHVLGKVRLMLGQWLRGQLTLSLIIGVMVYIGLVILDVPYASVLALLAGLLEAVPYVGPVIAAIPAVFFGFTVSPLRALAVLIFFWAIQVLENNLIVPKVMQKAVGINPLISIISILVGAKLAGVVGALLAIPVATSLTILLREIFSREHLSAEDEPSVFE